MALHRGRLQDRSRSTNASRQSTPFLAADVAVPAGQGPERMRDLLGPSRMLAIVSVDAIAGLWQLKWLDQ